MTKTYIVYPEDITTKFLLDIPNNLLTKVDKNSIEIIIIEASDESYAKGVEAIEKIPKDSIILFMGHGQYDLLYGAENLLFEKKPLIKRTDMRVFENKYLFSLSCYSNELLRSTFGYSKINNSLGFGTLPTEIKEVERNKKLMQQGVNENVIKIYKQILVGLVSDSFCSLIIKKLSFFEMSNFFLLLLNKKISQVILEDRKNNDARILADLLFQMRTEIVFI
jgi:hypothetical protein